MRKSDLKNDADDDVILWGANAISRKMNCTERKLYHLNSKKKLPFVKKVGGQLCARIGAIREYFK